MASLVADVGIFALTGQSTGAGLLAEAGIFSLAGEAITINRQYDVNLGNLKLRLERLNVAFPVVDNQGRPTGQFQRFWQKHCEAIEQSFSALASAVLAIQTAYDAASQATAAASQASDAAAQATEAVSTVNNVVDDLQNGDLNLPAITVGGKKFVNDGSGLVLA